MSPRIREIEEIARSVDEELELLVVDDDPAVREIIIGNLAEKFPAATFRQAGAGNEALTLINERVPDLVLLDLRMPGLNGFTLTRLIRTRDRTAHIPIITISALSDRGSVQKAVEAGATDYCVKPIDFESLGEKIERILIHFLHKTNLKTNQRNSSRRPYVGSMGVLMPVYFPENDGVWVESTVDLTDGTPLLFNGARFFKSLRLDVDNPFWWSRVEHCQAEEEAYRVKLLFEYLPENYEDQIEVLNRSSDRFHRNFVKGPESLNVEFPCELRDLSGEGLKMVGTLPWKLGDTVDLDLEKVIRELSIETEDSTVGATVRWAEKEGPHSIAGVHFTRLEEDLRNALMAWTLAGVPK